jgi:hypothetical protein
METHLMRKICVITSAFIAFSANAATADDMSGDASGEATHELHQHHEVPPPASDSNGDSPDHSAHGGHAHHEIPEPIGVMGAHMHPKGGFMFSYRYSRMRMDGNRDGTSKVPVDDILLPNGSYMVSPTDMDMQMHMFGAMYAPADWVTLMAMIPYVELSMDHHMANGNRFETNSKGVGDLRLSGLFKIFQNDTHSTHLNFGLSFPTGGIGHKDQLPVPMMGFQNKRLPYPMQIGSGTWDILPGATYLGSTDWLGWGAQVIGTVRFGENRHDYRLGHRADATAWLTLPVLDWLDLSARFVYAYWGNIEGADSSLNPNAVPTADPDLRKGQRIDLLAGLSVKLPWDRFGEHRFGVEAGGPPWQKLDGPQLGSKWRVTAGWQLTF